MRWLGKHAARTVPLLGRIAQRSASVRLSARAQPMSARQNAKPSEQTAHDLKFQKFAHISLSRFTALRLPFLPKKCCSTAAPKPHAASHAFRAFTAASGALYHATFEARFLARLRRAAQALTHFCFKRQRLIIFIGSSEFVKLRAARFRPRPVL